MTESDRRVLIYSSEVLPVSQTFVADQARALRRWTPTLVGRQRSANGLAVDDMVADEVAEISAAGAIRTIAMRGTRRVPVLREVSSRLKPELIHAHFLTGGFDVMASLRPAPCPVVVTAHGFDATWFGAPPRTMRPDRWLHGELRRRLARSGVRFIAVSRFIRDQLVSYGVDPALVSVLHTGVDTDYFSNRRALADRDGILFVGRLVPKKGVLDLLQAVVQLRDRGVNAPVEIIGDGPERRSIERFVSHHRLRVTLRGAQDRDAVRAAMERATVLCAPSRTGRNGDREGFGMVLAEAQATGTPVVATRCGGMVDAVADGNGGFLVQESDPVALARSLEVCLSDSDRWREMSVGARRWVVGNLDLKRQTALLEDLYDSLAQR